MIYIDPENFPENIIYNKDSIVDSILKRLLSKGRKEKVKENIIMKLFSV